MATESLSERKFGEERWYDATVALLVGTLVFGGMVFHSLSVQMPKESPPVEAAPLVVIMTAAAAISYLLLRRKNAIGYDAAAVTGVLTVLTPVLIGAGVLGELKRRRIRSDRWRWWPSGWPCSLRRSTVAAE